MLRRNRTSGGLSFEALEPRQLLDASAQLVGDFNPIGGAFGSYATPTITEIGSKTFFQATNEYGTRYLWQMDGSRSWRIKSAPELDYGEFLIAAGDQLFFRARDAVELWRTDGTEEGTMPVFNSDNQTLSIRQIAASGEDLYFVVEDIHGERWLWFSDGTADGTVSLGENASQLTDFRDSLFFTVSRGKQTELWRSDGLSEGPEIVRVVPGRVTRLTAFDGVLFLTTVIDGRTELWKSDGANEGTELVSVIPGSASVLAMTEELLFLSVDDKELWRSDGTPTGTHHLADIDARRKATSAGDKLFFLAETDETGEELWVSDGTVEGTRLVRDIVPGRDGCGLARFVSIDDMLFFSAEDGNGNSGLWKSDGTEQGTVQVKVGPFTPLGRGDDVVYLRGYDESSGTELWKSDGTADGTVRVSDVNPGPADSLGRVVYVKEVDEAIYFTADDGIHGVELWRIPLADDIVESSPELLFGDADGNGTVQFADFVVLAANYGTVEDVAFADGDFDGSGKIDFGDFLILSSNYGKSRGPNADGNFAAVN